MMGKSKKEKEGTNISYPRALEEASRGDQWKVEERCFGTSAGAGRATGAMSRNNTRVTRSYCISHWFH